MIGCHAATARFFFGGYTHFSMAEGALAANASMAGLAGGSSDGRSNGPYRAPAFRPTTIRRSRNSCTASSPASATSCRNSPSGCPTPRWCGPAGTRSPATTSPGHAEAVAVARSADAVLLTLGGKHGTSSIASMGEGIDATDINLPRLPGSLITKLAELGMPLIGVHMDGRPISSDIAERHLNAIVEAWNPAERRRSGDRRRLTGELNPSGRLPVSVARSAGQIAVYYNHPYGSAWHQGESIGFPDYVDAPHTPRYHFGHGLSYTTFDYANLRLSVHEVEPEARCW